MFSLRPVTSRVLARIVRHSIEDKAVKTVEIDRVATYDLPPLIHLPDAFDRVLGHADNSSAERNVDFARGRGISQGPSRVHLLRDVLIADGSLLAAAAYSSIRTEPRRWLVREPITRVGEAMICSTHVGELYFGHWVLDQLAHELLARDQGIEPAALAGSNRPHEAGYRKLFDMEARMLSTAHVERLWVPEDWEYTPHRFARQRQLRARLRTAVSGGSGCKRVFVTRDWLASGRSLINQEELCKVLAHEGFAPVRPQDHTPAELATIFHDTEIVIGVEGSALTHALMAMLPGTGVLAIMGPHDFNMYYRLPCYGMGVNLGFAVADDEGQGRFSIPPKRLLETVALMEKVIGPQLVPDQP